MSDDEIWRVLKTHSAQLMRVESYVQASSEMLCVVAQKCGLDSSHIGNVLNDRAAELLQARLNRVEDSNPRLAAEIDLRPIPGVKPSP